jgi:hypothetical protein
VTADKTIEDGYTITGTLGKKVQISIADGAAVTLDNVDINGSGSWKSGEHAGITCLGDATIILKDGTTNTVRGFFIYYPGIQGAVGKTLTITGTGTLIAMANGGEDGKGAGIGSGCKSLNSEDRPCGDIVIEGGTITAIGGTDGGAGIGAGESSSCGDITITGGTITATGGSYGGAGIGSGESSSSRCGDITISGGTVEATGGHDGAAGIGSGQLSSCGIITITKGVTSFTANKGSDATSIGVGVRGYCGTVNIESGAKVTQK